MQSTIVTAVVVAACSALLFILGSKEKRRNSRNLEQLWVRVNVNGIRGKSTATRLITSILQQTAKEGYVAVRSSDGSLEFVKEEEAPKGSRRKQVDSIRCIGKTTGTAARLIYFDREEELPIQRKPRGVSLVEQIGVINNAVQLGANALVCECMAVNPDYQIAYQHQMVKATVTVIVNVIEDHLEEMGPTTEQIAWAFAETIPYNGWAIIPDCEFTDFFKDVAAQRNSKTIVINDAEIDPEFLTKFDYKLFDHNCAVALAAARAIGVPDDVAFRGMLNAHPDPGALRITQVGQKAVFVNGFAANEPSSSLDIWDVVVNENKYNVEKPIIVLCCRGDRVDRTEQFVRDFIPKMPESSLLVIGSGTGVVQKAYDAGELTNVIDCKSVEGITEVQLKEIMEYIEPMMAGRVIMGVGNIHGIGELFVEALAETLEKEEAAAAEK